MRIEKINENKIRCTLTRDDLEVRHMKLSEIAYGSEKARSLFRDMMEQASHQFGFEADNIPLMIEAIPMPNECIILDITKVVIFYGEDINNDIYYVPVTKYLNNNENKDKIDIIVEELTTSYIYEDNLRSILNENVELIDKEIIDEDLLVLNFNSALFDNNSTIKEEVLYTLSYSVFSNYDVNTISFKVDSKDIETIKRSSLT